MPTRSALAVLALGALAGCSAGNGRHAASDTPCDAQADYAFLADAAALSEAADGIFVGGVDAVREEVVDGVRTTVYDVEVRDVVRGEIPAGDELQVRETCTGDGQTTDPRLPVSGDDVVFFTTGAETAVDRPDDVGTVTRAWSVSGGQGHLASVDGGFRADVPGVRTPLLTDADVESLRRSTSS